MIKWMLVLLLLLSLSIAPAAADTLLTEIGDVGTVIA